MIGKGEVVTEERAKGGRFPDSLGVSYYDYLVILGSYCLFQLYFL